MAENERPINSGPLECAVVVLIDGVCAVLGGINSGITQAIAFSIAAFVTFTFLYLAVFRHKIKFKWKDMTAGGALGALTIATFSYFYLDSKFVNYRNTVNHAYQSQLDALKLDKDPKFLTSGLYTVVSRTIGEVADWLDVVDADANRCIAAGKREIYILVDSSNMAKFYQISANKDFRKTITSFKIVRSFENHNFDIAKTGERAKNSCDDSFSDSAKSGSSVQIRLRFSSSYQRSIRQYLSGDKYKNLTIGIID